MADEKLEEWVRQKLENGVSEERIRESLENTGHDPSLVDSVNNPFEEEDAEGESQVEQGSAGEDEEDVSLEEEPGSVEEHRETVEGSGETVFQRFRRVFSGLGLPAVPYRLIGVVVLVLVVAGAGFMGWQRFGGIIGGSGGSSGGCPDVGVRINSVTVSHGVTTADVLVTRKEADVVLEVFSGGELVDASSASFRGGREMDVPAVGDRVVFHPAGCDRLKDSYEVN